MRNEELGMRSEGMLFCKKLLLNRGVAKQHKPKLFTIQKVNCEAREAPLGDYSLFTHHQGEVH